MTPIHQGLLRCGNARPMQPPFNIVADPARSPTTPSRVATRSATSHPETSSGSVKRFSLDSATFASELLRSKPLLHMIVRFEESATQEFREDGVCGANGEKYGQAGAQCVGDDKFGGREFGAHGA